MESPVNMRPAYLRICSLFSVLAREVFTVFPDFCSSSLNCDAIQPFPTSRSQQLRQLCQWKHIISPNIRNDSEWLIGAIFSSL